jgi:hypothetical protein
MPDYRVVKHPARLKAIDLLDSDEPVAVGAGLHAAGMGLKGEPSQLDIVYRDDRTLVFPVNPPKGVKPWAFKGIISSADCVTWLRASLSTANG